MTFPKPFYQWRPHPWHGLTSGEDPPNIVNAYIEITPYDGVKYEIDKQTGYLRVDRPQRNSSLPPTLYGFIPKTFCGSRVGALSNESDWGDGDPLDICVVSERPINRAEVLLSARVVGGIKLIDQGEVDDKVIAVLANDPFWNRVQNMPEFPDLMVERLVHYFQTYKLRPGEHSLATIEEVYPRNKAYEVINASLEDYTENWGQ